LIPLEHLALAIVDGLVMGCVATLIALGLSIVFGVMGVINLVHGELYTLGAMTAWLLTYAALPFASSLVAAPLLSASLAVAINMFILQRLGHEPGRTILATFGLLLILQQISLAVMGPAPRSVPPPINVAIEFPGFGYSGYSLAVGVASLIIALVTWLSVGRSRLGLILRAVQENRPAAEALGIDTGKVMVLGFALSGALAGLAGAMAAPMRQVHFLMGIEALTDSLVVVVLGGVGSLGGTVAAGLVLGLLEGLTALFFEPTLARVISLALAINYLAIRRLGIAGGE